MTILKTTNLKKKFGNIIALDGVDLEVKKGEVYGFIGPNGAGKTTTIRILLGILQSDEGEATVFGKDVWKNPVEIHKKVAYVPGEVNLWPNLSGGEVIDFFVRLRGSNNKNRRAELIEKFNLDPSKKCRSYSKGNRQKVALISAFAAEADLYILDEPTSGLDPLMEKVFQECVLDLKKEGKSIFLSSHILSEVEKLCDKVSIIRKGKIIESGTLDELRHLTRTIVQLKTREEISGLAEVKGVYDIEKENHTYTFDVDTDKIDNVIKHLSEFNILKLEISPPKLENLFMHHYKENGGVS